MRFFFLFVLFFSISCSNSVKIESSPDNSQENDTAITDLKVEKNAENHLSCRLSFKTNSEKTFTVRYFSENHSGYEIVGKKTNDHYFFLWGMRAETKYVIEIFYQGEDEPVTTTEFVTGKLPDSVPPMILKENKAQKASEGFVLFYYNYIPMERTVSVLLMLDNDGEIVWYYEYISKGFSILGDVQYIKKTGTILIGVEKGENMIDIPAEEAVEIDIEGTVIWKSRELANVYSDKNSWHHIYELLEDDTIVMLRCEFIGNVISDLIVNIDRNYNELWVWQYKDHFQVPECDPQEICDWTHSNSVSMFREQKIAYLNSRNRSQFYKIDMETGEIIWTFGKGGDFTMLSDIPDPWFELAHDPEILTFNDDEILFYDNGTPERGYSRAIKYRIDDVNMTAEVIFNFDGSDENRWYTEYWGDADTMENGNTFIAAGEFEEGDPSKFIEVSSQGEVVWELLFPETEELKVILYNSCKFKPELKML